MEVLTNLIVIVLSQSMHVSNHHLVHLRLTYLNKPGEKFQIIKTFAIVKGLFSLISFP